MNFYKAIIGSIEKLTPDAVSITLQVDHPELFKYKPGQYIVLRVPSLNPDAHRSYSISAAPYENKITIGLKKIEDGLVSTHLCDHAKEGDVVEMMMPEGSFIIPQYKRDLKIIAFAAGSGITPILSHIKAVLHSCDQARLSLFYGNKTSESVLYQNQLSQLLKDYGDRFELIKVFSREKVGLADLEGRIDREKINRWKSYMFDIQSPDYFLICGPGDMVQDITVALQNAGVPSEKVLNEYFSSPEEIKPVEITLTDLESSTIKIKFEKKTYTLEKASIHSVILDHGLQNGIDLPYSCKSGVCSTCQAKLISGKVTMDHNYVLSEKEIAQGYILTCQSHALTPVVEVEY